jgi:polyketide biosynthesis enoyl-CoA hydratase PksI
MSGVVTVKFVEPSIAVVKMEDRANRNGFSPELVQSLIQAWSELRDRGPEVKVVVIHGYDRIFSAGGTREELLALQNGRKDFTDRNFYRLLLDCEVPVVAAMQGHAIGGGLVFGLYADIVILAEECLYSANFMSFGFTPGMGATLALPEKLGSSVAAEMFYTARGYHGGELRRLGVTARVEPQEKVLTSALDTARAIAEKPRETLVLLKAALTESVRERLPAAVERELAMHRATFHRPEVRRRIEAMIPVQQDEGRR